VDGDEGHRVARVDQFVRLAQDDVRHRPEDEQRHQNDDADGRVKQRTMQVQQAGEALVREGGDAFAERRVPFERGVRDCFIEARALLAREIAAGAVGHANLGFQCRDETPAIGSQPHREVVQVKRLGEKHVLDALRIVA
jgi:hypothetical protein